MKNSTKIFGFVLFLAIMDFTFSCCPPAYSDYTVKYSHCQIEAKNLDNSGEYPRTVETGEIPKEAYGIQLNIMKSENKCEEYTYKPILFSSAYACDREVYANYEAIDSISSINIYTLNDFDSNHPGNSEVNDLFSVFENNHFSTISEYLANKEYNFYGSEFFMTEKLNLLLMQAPPQSGEFQFRVEVLLSDGRLLTGTTPLISLN